MAQRHNGRRWALGGAGAACATVIIVGFVVPVTLSARIAPSSVPSSVISPDAGTTPSVSGDGRLVVFVAAPAQPDGRSSSVWLKDRATSILTELTVAKDGVRLGDSLSPVISADGCTVAVITEMAFDLFRDDDRGSRHDVYRLTLPACGGASGDWELVSTISGIDGQDQARGDVDPTQPPAVSTSGTVVAYARPYRSLSGNDDLTHRPTAVDVVDLGVSIDQFGRSTLAAGLPAEAPGNGATFVGQRDPALSGDGTIVVFSSDATSDEPVPEWVAPRGAESNAVSQIYAWDRSDPDPFTSVTLMSSGASGPANQSAITPAVSADGRLVSFASSATNLVASASLDACVVVCPPQIYAIDRDVDENFVYDEDGTTQLGLVSRVPNTNGSIVAADGASSSPTMSGDGNTVAFLTQASNLLPVQTPGGGASSDGDLLVADLITGGLRRAFDSPAPAPGAHGHPRLSANGRVLVADSLVGDRLVADSSIVGRHVVAASLTPDVSIAQSDLGTVAVGVPGPEWYVNVTNNGPGAFVPAMVTSDSADFAVTGGSCLDFSAVPAGRTCSVKLLLTPSVSGVINGVLTVSEAGFGAITLTSPLKGAGGEPALEANPAGADFEPTLVRAQSAPQIFNIANVFVGPTAVSSIAMSGANPDDFTVAVNGCVGQINTGESCPVVIVFNPTAAGWRTATVTIGTAALQYTSIFVGGQGFYDASLTTTNDARPGQRLGIGGSGFPANAAVLIGWSDGTGRSAAVFTDVKGDFITTMLIPKGERHSQRTLVAQVSAGPLASVVVDIHRATTIAPTSPAWPRP